MAPDANNVTAIVGGELRQCSPSWLAYANPALTSLACLGYSISSQATTDELAESSAGFWSSLQPLSLPLITQRAREQFKCVRCKPGWLTLGPTKCNRVSSFKLVPS